jgi:type IV secretory pathway VirJ component
VDQLCSLGTTRTFAAAISRATVIALPKVGHGYGVERNWLPQFSEAYRRMVAATAEPRLTDSAVADLPLVEVPASAAVRAGGELAVLLTGDGGWAGLDRDLAAGLAAQGIPVVALSTLRYFWTERTPAEAGSDLDRVLRHYLTAWKKQRALLVGYSFGANVLPFVTAELPEATRARVRSVDLIAPAKHAEFTIRVADWIPGSIPAGRPTLPAIAALGSLPVACLYGTDEADSPCPQLQGVAARAVQRLPGGHHFNGDAALLVRAVLGQGFD